MRYIPDRLPEKVIIGKMWFWSDFKQCMSEFNQYAFSLKRREGKLVWVTDCKFVHIGEMVPTGEKEQPFLSQDVVYCIEEKEK